MTKKCSLCEDTNSISVRWFNECGEQAQGYSRCPDCLQAKLNNLLAASKKALTSLDAFIASHPATTDDIDNEASDELHAAILRCEK